MKIKINKLFNVSVNEDNSDYCSRRCRYFGYGLPEVFDYPECGLFNTSLREEAYNNWLVYRRCYDCLAAKVMK